MDAPEEPTETPGKSRKRENISGTISKAAKKAKKS
jgi:hypothetical protein